MKVTITGAAGFIGQKLARALLDGRPLIGADGASQTVSQLILADVVAPPPVPASDDRVTVVTGDIAEPDFLAAILPADVASVFHMAAVVSAGAEADFDLGMAVNLTATQRLF